MSEEVEKNSNNNEQNIQISEPDPFPVEDDPQKKIKTNRLPRPSPQKIDPSTAKSEGPMSSETISIKRSDIKADETPKIDVDKRKLKILCYHCGQKLDLTDMEPFSEVECPSCNLKIIVPKWFENYLLEEPGGEGGMATVYRALDLTLDREVAIKILHASFAEEADKCQLFLHEARTAATINHYAVIPVYTCGISGKTPYIVMQYMEGGALDKKLEKANGKLPVNQVLKWIKDVADGLDNARRHGIIHHDVKPANILLDRDENAKIGDFGIAQILHDWRSENISKITKNWASPNYVSPEKVLTGREDHFGDIYSLGVTLFQLLTGTLPFDHEDVKTLITMRLQKDPPVPKEIRAEIPLKISNLILAMMDRSPEKRPSYREIINEIESHLKLTETIKKSSSQEKEQKIEKVESLKRQKSTKKARQANRLLSQIKQRKETSPLQKILTHSIITLSILGIIFVLWKSGALESKIGRRGIFAKTMPKDYIPEVTAFFRSGDPASAAKIAKETFHSTSNSNVLSQAAIQWILALYLQNSPDAKAEAHSIAEKLSNFGFREDEPAMIILRFLANGKTKTQALKDAFSDDDYYRALASYCLFIKAIHDGENNLEIVSLSRRCISAGEKISTDFWGNAWFERVPLWKDWLEFGKGDSPSLEPLIQAHKYEITVPISSRTIKPKSPVQQQSITEAPVVQQSAKTEQTSELIVKPSEEKELSSLSLSTLSVDWLRNDRNSFASNRPRPRDYNFNSSQLQKYISSVPENRREVEAVRAQHVASMKNYLCMLLSKTSYDKEITTTDGRKFRGNIMANINYISVKTSKGYERLDWSKLSPNEFLKIISHFADVRLRVSGSAGTSTESRKKEASEDYLRLALFADWYGDYEKAVEFASKAASVYPANENKVKKYMFK